MQGYIGTVQETPAVVHKILAPYGIEGIVKDVKSVDFTITDTVVTLTHNEKKQIYQCYKFGPYVRNGHLLKIAPKSQW